MLDKESKDDSDGHTIFSKQNKCNASTEMVRIILATCLHEMEKCCATVECFKLFPPRTGYLKSHPYVEFYFPPKRTVTYHT